MASFAVSPIKKIVFSILSHKHRSALICGLAFFSFLSVAPAQAATLFYSPAQGSYDIGKSFSVGIYAGSADQSLNAFTGTMSFPADLLQVTSVSKSGSIANLWVQEPSFSNSAGTVTFGGLVLNPGFQGKSGKILTVTFKTKAAGTANVSFSAGEILANDGSGTNIMQGLGSAQFKVNAAAETKPATDNTVKESETQTAVASGLPDAPVITSATNPDANAWYNNGSPKFSWTLPKDVTAVRTLYDKYPASDPAIVYQPPVAGKDLSDVTDGVYYMHVQFRNAKGWGPVSHFRFQVDTTPPAAFAVKFPHGSVGSDPRPVVMFNTTDELSGIAYYEVKVGEGEAFKVLPGEMTDSNPYVMPVQRPGQHAIIVKASDKAGNSSTASEIFSVSALDAPALDYFSNELTEGDILKISGKTYPSSIVTVFVKDEAGLTSTDKVNSNSLGNFTLIWSKKLMIGTYSIWAQVSNADGAKSAITTPSNFVVKQSMVDKITNLLVDYLSLVLLLAFFILGLVFFAWYGWHKFLLLKRRVKKGVKGMERNLVQIFDDLQSDIEQQIELIEKAKDKRELTKEEKKIITILKRDLTVAKKLLNEEMKNMSDYKD